MTGTDEGVGRGGGAVMKGSLIGIKILAQQKGRTENFTLGKTEKLYRADI